MAKLILYSAMVSYFICLPFAISGSSCLTTCFLIKTYQLDIVAFLTSSMYVDLLFAYLSDYFFFDDLTTEDMRFGSLLIFLANIIAYLPNPVWKKTFIYKD